MYYFDNYGWYTSNQIPGRQTDIAPPDPSTIPQGYAANFTGYSWIVVPYVPPPDIDKNYIKKVIAQAVKDHFDRVVQTRDYFNMDSACSYALSTIPSWKAEGDACVQWRDACWVKCYEILGQVDQGLIPQPTVDDILSMLPEMVWPT